MRPGEGCGNLGRAAEKILLALHQREKLFLQSAKDGEPRDFDKALRLCKDNVAREEVRRAQADYYFHKEDYIRAAQ